MRIVNGGPLVKPLDRLALVWEGILSKDLLGSGSTSFGVLPQCHRSVHLSVL